MTNEEINKIDIINICYLTWLLLSLFSLLIVGLPAFEVVPPVAITDIPKFLGSWWHIYFLCIIGLVMPKSKKIKLAMTAHAMIFISLLIALINGVRFIRTNDEFVKTTGYLLICSSIFGIIATIIQAYMKIKEV